MLFLFVMKSTDALGLQAFFEISRNLDQALNLEQALRSVLQVLTESLATRKAAVILLNTETGQLLRCVFQGSLPEDQEWEGIPRLEEIAFQMRRRPQPFVWPEGSQVPRFLARSAPELGDKGQIVFLGVPVVHRGSLLGVVVADCVFGLEAPLEEDLRFLTMAAGVMAQIISVNRQVKARMEVLQRENMSLKAALAEKTQNQVMVGQSAAMAEVRQALKTAAAGKGPVLLTGETGAGKSTAARVIHDLSHRSGYPFIKVNCASLPENLLEAEIFGCEPGALPGAPRAKPGRLEEADGGTLFLEEVAELTPHLQDRLLKFLQEREFQRLGSAKPRKVEMRLIAATSRDLDAEVKAGSFREELYERLRVSAIHLSPVKERREDITPLLNHFLDRVSQEYGRRFYFTQVALGLLQEYDWPGNVREMENLVERLALIVEDGEMDVNDLPSYLLTGAPDTGGPEHLFRSRLKEMERREIVAALERNRWVQSQAAVELGLTLRQIGYRVKQFGLERVIREHRSQLISRSGGARVGSHLHPK
ncbi:MAG: GAF domain-containing protein [Deltaproteobacteria bacterium]|nr:GAF domain-containing protein [Deltaproteobacteria bacterium]